MTIDVLFTSSKIGSIRIKNRFVRSSTSESMADAVGRITEDYISLYRTLARGGAGLILTGHIFVHPRGQFALRQAGIHDDVLVSSLKRFTDLVHQDGGTIFAELGHAGSQTKVASVVPLAPSPVENFISHRRPEEASEGDIEEVIAAYGAAARRVREAGFDGVHLHAGHGYLISQFSSPFTNRRDDEWGGTPEKRGRFLIAVFNAVRSAVGADFPVTVKLGLADTMAEGGLGTSESVQYAVALEEAGCDAIEVSVGIMHVLTNRSVGWLVAVSPMRAVEDLVFHRILYPSAAEAYFLPYVRALKPKLKRMPLILVGGIRSTQMMERLINDGDVDFISMARPFIREPDIPNQVRAGRRGLVNCVSCNICGEHDGHHPLQCWRTPKRRLLHHLMLRAAHALGLRAQ